MSLTRIGIAAGLVAFLFLLSAWIERRPLARGPALVALVEAGVASLLAALWFGSLGTGGWGTLFATLGLLVGVAGRGRRLGQSGEALGLALDVLRYIAAGAVLAWRLG